MNEQAPVASPRGRMIGHALMAAAGVAALATALDLGLWRRNSPGEGLFPFLTALAMTAFGAAGFIQDWTKRNIAPPPPSPDRRGRIRVAAYLGALVFYAGSLELLGFVVATVVSIVFILRYAERYPWLATLALTAGTVIGCQVLFVFWLGAMLPTGTLWASLIE